MSGVTPCPLPVNALLRRYCKDGFHTDCFAIELPLNVSLEQFILAFYTGYLFRVERFILKWAISRPSTDAELALLASGAGQDFAAWSVEERAADQLLLSDFQGRTRSWLMVAPADIKAATEGKAENESHTTLYFGSAVVPRLNSKTGKLGLGLSYKLLSGFHKLYSVALLSAAAKNLLKH